MIENIYKKLQLLHFNETRKYMMSLLGYSENRTQIMLFLLWNSQENRWWLQFGADAVLHKKHCSTSIIFPHVLFEK